MAPSEFLSAVRSDLENGGLFGIAANREACADRARTIGQQALEHIEWFVGTRAARRAFAIRGPAHVESLRYVAGYGELMTTFLVAPLTLEARAQAEVARLGGLANVIVGYFDDMVDNGWPRTLLLPELALRMASSSRGRFAIRMGTALTPAPSRLIQRMVCEYFRRLENLPYTGARRLVRADVIRCIATMYFEEGRTQREWRRLRGSATMQRKTALPLVVLGLPGWLATRHCEPDGYRRHRRWLGRLGRFVRWIDDTADAARDRATGHANLVVRALARGEARRGDALALMIGRRGRRISGEWRELMLAAHRAPAQEPDVLAAVLAAWLSSPSGR